MEMVGVVESAMPSVSANPLLVAYQRAGFLGGENGEAPEKRRTRREIAKDICDAAVEDLRRSWETRALLPLYRSLEAASSKNARGTVDVILRDLQDTRRTLEQLIAYLESEPGLDAAELCLARHEEKCDVLETSGVIDNRIFQDPILDAPEKVLQRIRDQFRNDAQNDVIAELYSAILNAPQQPDPI